MHEDMHKAMHKAMHICPEKDTARPCATRIAKLQSDLRFCNQICDSATRNRFSTPGQIGVHHVVQLRAYGCATEWRHRLSIGRLFAQVERLDIGS
jgi:hypothetical protein